MIIQYAIISKNNYKAKKIHGACAIILCFSTLYNEPKCIGMQKYSRLYFPTLQWPWLFLSDHLLADFARSPLIVPKCSHFSQLFKALHGRWKDTCFEPLSPQYKHKILPPAYKPLTRSWCYYYVTLSTHCALHLNLMKLSLPSLRLVFRWCCHRSPRRHFVNRVTKWMIASIAFDRQRCLLSSALSQTGSFDTKDLKWQLLKLAS